VLRVGDKDIVGIGVGVARHYVLSAVWYNTGIISIKIVTRGSLPVLPGFRSELSVMGCQYITIQLLQ
jgi:hypothetical protein